MSEFRRRSVYVLAFVGALLVVGTIGFTGLGWNVSDSLYMTVITFTGVGYQEVRPLDGSGRLLASVLLFGGLTAVGLWFALITSAIVEMDLAHVFRKRRTMKNIDRIKDHVIVCGAGRTGRQVIKELIRAETPFVVIERDPETAEILREMDDELPILEADSTDDETLIRARIGQAKGLVAALSADTDNLFVCLSARDLQPQLTIVTRAYNEETMSKMRKAGAGHSLEEAQFRRRWD